jgi:hypothetical protein
MHRLNHTVEKEPLRLGRTSVPTSCRDEFFGLRGGERAEKLRKDGL